MIFFFDTRYIYFLMKARVFLWLSRLRSSSRRLRVRTFDGGVVAVSRVLFIEARSSGGAKGGWGGRVRRLFLQWRPIKISKLFWPAKFAWVIRTSPSRCCKKFPLCLRDCRTVFASRQEMHLHNVLTSQATAWNGFFLENIFAVDQLFNGPFWSDIKNYWRPRVIAL